MADDTVVGFAGRKRVLVVQTGSGSLMCSDVLVLSRARSVEIDEVGESCSEMLGGLSQHGREEGHD